MNLREMYKYVLDKLNLEEGDRRNDSIIKTAINNGVIELAKYDCNISEDTIRPLSRVNELPDDFLIELSLYHNQYGLLSDSQYKISGKSLIIPSSIIMYSSPIGLPEGEELDYITLIYGTVPDKLIEDTDEPSISSKYHMGIVYYALHEMTNDSSYYNLFKEIVDSVPVYESFLDDGDNTEVVKDVYGW